MSVADELGEALDEHLIEDLAGTAAFGRGVGYLHDRRVQAVDDRDGRMHAEVRGTVPYRVEMGFDGSPRRSPQLRPGERLAVPEGAS